MSIGANPQINTFHGTNFVVTISNIPTLEYENELSLYHNFIRSISLPGFSIDMILSDWRGEQYLNPGSHKNNELGDVSITFQLTENLMNYFYMAQYIMDMRYEYSDTNADGGDYRIKMNFIKAIDVDILDNSKRKVANIKFSRCFPTEISNIELDYTNGQEMSFTVTFKFTELNFSPINAEE